MSNFNLPDFGPPERLRFGGKNHQPTERPKVVFDLKVIREQRDREARMAELQQKIKYYSEYDIQPEQPNEAIEQSKQTTQPELPAYATGSDARMFALEHLFGWIGKMTSLAFQNSQNGTTWTKTLRHDDKTKEKKVKA